MKSSNNSISTSPDIIQKSSSSSRSKRKLNHTASDIPHSEHSSTKATTLRTTTAEMDKRNHDFCDACGEAGQFLCCDACPNAFHFTCVEPPMDSTDVANLKDKWFCNECEHAQNKGRKRTKSNPRGLFHKLIEDISAKNPTAFKLPNDIVHFFKDVASDKQGRYVDTSQIKQVKYKLGQVEHPDYHQLKDKSGKFRQCYYCRETALKKPIISCDYCPLYWHLDCLKLASPPNPAKKWRCPTHFENIIKPPREQRNPTTPAQAPAKITINNENKLPSSAYRYYLGTIIEKQSISHVDKSTTPTPVPAPTPTPTQPVENIITSKYGVVYRLPVNPIQLDFSDYVKSKKAAAVNDTQQRRSSIPSTTESSSSSSEVNTPPTSFNSPTSHKAPITHPSAIDSSSSDNEVEAWLENMACFQSGSEQPLPAATTILEKEEVEKENSKPIVDNDFEKEYTKRPNIDNNGLLTLIRAATTATTTKTNSSSPPSSPIPNTKRSLSLSSDSSTSSSETITIPKQKQKYRVEAAKYEKYQQIEKLLWQKSEQELIGLFQQK